MGSPPPTATTRGACRKPASSPLAVAWASSAVEMRKLALLHALSVATCSVWAPDTKIVAVAHAEGIDFLMNGAKDRNGNEYAALVSALKSQGVRFEVCEITLRNRNLKKDGFIEEADFTPSGVVRIARLQKEGYAYIKP